MNAVATYTKSGTKSVQPVKLPKKIFSVEIKNSDLLKTAYLATLTIKRQNLAKVLTRGEVRGGGKKPWRQKGLGRARVGSIRVPNWRGGGVAFGPTGNENYVLKLSRQSKKTALRQALSLKAKDNQVDVIEAISLSTAKTKEFAKLLQKIQAGRNVLIVVDNLSDELNQASRNLTEVEVTPVKSITVYKILNAGKVIITKPAITILDQWLGGNDE